ncbi:MAG: ABC transporter ATP-binding protein [Roseburia sp.]|nr:ABC transporter ATP-binding protein [Roseburia sp.]MCM1098678.1 ABC transporter ATP-binding protein [Ruminococcus flavefaciens]
MLEIRGLSKTYPGKVRALVDVELKLGPGEIVGLFGENGAGKTTLLKCILGYLPFRGEVLLEGKAIDREQLGRLSFATCEHSFFPNLTPRGHEEFYQSQFDGFRHRRFEALMRFFELPMTKSLRTFSTGQKNQFEVIMALCQGADYILMDEPFAGNDIFNREDFYKVLLGILEPGETVFLSTHLIEEVENFVSRAVLLRKGRIVGDVTTLDLEEQGITLTDYIKQVYGYQANRVNQALEELTGGRM